MSLPKEFIERIMGQPGLNPENLLKALEEPSPVSIRMNTVKWDNIPLISEHVPWCRNGYYLESRPSFTLDPLFHAGCYYPQEASSMFIEQVLNQCGQNPDGIRVLDLCGAPGGKSIHLSDIIGKGSFLVSNEVIRQRASVLSETITKWGKGNAIVTSADPSAFGKLSGYFDVIVVDAPCSGEGMFRNGIAVNEWSEANAALCAERQKRILMDIWPSLKENGLLIYSTCTFNPGENEKNIKWLTEKNEAECIRLDITPFPGIKEIDFEGIYGYGFYPDRIKGEGFFISAVRKKGSQDEIRIRGNKSLFSVPGKKDLQVNENWSFFPKEHLVRFNDDVLALPCGTEDLAMISGNLRIVRAGTKVFTLKRDDYLPSHDLAISVHLKKDAFQKVELKYKDAISYLRRDNIHPGGIQNGWNIVTYQGVNLGFINNLGNRVNNYYPVEWRIRMIPSGKESIIQWQVK